jgi:hypothetical protein
MLAALYSKNVLRTSNCLIVRRKNKRNRVEREPRTKGDCVKVEANKRGYVERETRKQAGSR